MVGHIRLKKLLLSIFPKKCPNSLSKNNATLYIVIHFNDFFKHCSIVMGYIHEIDKTNISQFFKKILFKD